MRNGATHEPPDRGAITRRTAQRLLLLQQPRTMVELTEALDVGDRLIRTMITALREGGIGVTKVGRPAYYRCDMVMRPRED